MECTLKLHQPVLVRNNSKYAWIAEHFSHYRKDDAYPFVCAGGASYQQCIPAEGNEHLVGTTDSPVPPEPEFKLGDFVEVRDNSGEKWRPARFLYKEKKEDVYFPYRVIFEEKKDIEFFQYCRHAKQEG